MVNSMERFYPRWNAKIWETGEFSFGYLPAKRLDRKELPPEFGVDREDLTNICNCIKAHGYEETSKFLKANPELYPSISSMPSPLGSTPVPSSLSPVQGGKSGISGER
jgi:hypothetical protein